MDVRIGAVLFAAVWMAHSLSPNATSFDSRWVVHTALSLLKEGNTDLNEYAASLEKENFYAIECLGSDGTYTLPIRSRAQCAGGRLYHLYPVAVPLLAAPGVFVIERATALAQPVLAPLAARTRSPIVAGFLRGDLAEGHAIVEILIASLLVALATVLVYLIAREFLVPLRSALLASLFAFATPAWSTASRALWQHGPSMLLLAAALLVTLKAQRRPTLIRWAGLPLVLAFFVRPTNILPLAAFSLFVLIHYRRHFLFYLLYAAPAGLLFLAYDLHIYGSLLAPYSSPARTGVPGLALHARLLEALAGLWVSPARGLLIFVPLFLFSFWGMALAPLSAQARRLRYFLIAVIGAHWLLMALYADWYGGHSYGPRYFSDMTPYFTWFLIPVLARLRPLSARTVLFVALAAASVFIHCRGATVWASYLWNVQPVEINQAPSRLWDWKDPPFLRGL